MDVIWARAWRMLGANARAETVAKVAMFRDAYARRRCLAPETCYYEWTGERGAKTMWRFTVAEQPIFAFAGLWERAGPSGGE